jgi:2-polyprenyl-3-methyl-5-hydroxy-6-metoxy-1,4-benzoquinol methylase
MNSLSKIYSEHHQNNRKRNFVIFEEERAKFIRENVQTGKTILDIGCRDGALTKHGFNNNKITGCDIDPEALKHAEQLGVETILIDLNGNWSELNGKKYDIIFAFEIIEHLYFPEKVLEKIDAHLNTGGKFIGSLPNAFSLTNRVRLAFGRKNGTTLCDPTHINHFSYLEIRKMLDSHFRNVIIFPLVDKKWMILAKVVPSLFGFMFNFKADKK